MDHVPPKVLLAPPFPPNLITVPACEACNKSFKADDDYTAAVAAMDIRGQNHETGRARWNLLAGGLRHPSAAGFSALLAGQQELGRVLGPNGLPLGGRIRSDKDRIDATGRHIVRGLYFHLTESPLPESAELTVGCQAGMDARHESMQLFSKFWEQWEDRVSVEVGEGFRFRRAAVCDQSMWLIELFDYLSWMAVIRQQPLEP